MTAYILARTLQEAHTFAREDLELPRGHYRVVNSPGTLKAVRGADLHLVPGYQNRYDRFAMVGALKWTRLDIVDWAKIVEYVEALGEVPAVETPDGLTPPGVQLTVVPEWHDDQSVVDATDFFADAMVSEGGPTWDTPGDPLKDLEAAKVAVEEGPKKNRRRRRCNDCGTLHFKDEVCVQTEALEGV